LRLCGKFSRQAAETQSRAKVSERIDKVTAELKDVADGAKTSFGSFNAQQLNWKPADKSWSVAQCFDHLITTHSLYFTEFERLTCSDAANNLWEKISPLSGFFGRFLIKGLDPKNQKPMKTTSKAEPSSSEISGDIIDRYVEHQGKMIAALKNISADIDPSKRIITSPLLGLVTYTLNDAYTVLVVHSQRHLGQAKRVMEADGFPK
jgi:uncharacterized damage-inducible protein DinB